MKWIEILDGVVQENVNPYYLRVRAKATLALQPEFWAFLAPLRLVPVLRGS